MRNILLKITTVISCCVMFVTPPFHAYAVVPPFLDWGGYAIMEIPCTCSGTFWFYFTPLYLSSVPMSGPMVYAPWYTVPFPNYDLIAGIGAPYLGAYVAGAQTCWMIGEPCFPLETIGTMAWAGVGLPGGK